MRLDVQALRRLKPELDLFLERYLPLFGRDEAQDHAHRFVTKSSRNCNGT